MHQLFRRTVQHSGAANRLHDVCAWLVQRRQWPHRLHHLCRRAVLDRRLVSVRTLSSGQLQRVEWSGVVQPMRRGILHQRHWPVQLCWLPTRAVLAGRRHGVCRLCCRHLHQQQQRRRVHDVPGGAVQQCARPDDVLRVLRYGCCCRRACMAVVTEPLIHSECLS